MKWGGWCIFTRYKLGTAIHEELLFTSITFVCDIVYDSYMIFSTGFDLMEVGRDEVTLRTGKQANKRNIQFAHQALLALFGK